MNAMTSNPGVGALAWPRFSRVVATLLLVAALATQARADLSIPRPTGWVTDPAGALRAEARRWLEANCDALKRQKQVELAVLVVPDLQGTTVEDFAQRAYDDWKIGDKQSRRGLLLLVAVNDRKVRLHVGYGLEGDLPDGKVGAILDRGVLPGFRAGDLSGGVMGGVSEVMTSLGAVPTLRAESAPRQSTRRRGSSGSPVMFWVIVFIVFGLAGVSPTWRWILFEILLHSASNSRSYGSSGGGFGGFGGGSGFGGFGGGSSGGGGASRSW